MNTHVCVTVRWLNDRFNGLVEDRKSTEWPPAPLRLIQALVAGAYQHGIYESSLSALKWLERQQAPDILALQSPNTGTRFDHYVPDNDANVVHHKPGVRTFEPVLLETRPVVHYLWRITVDDPPPVNALDALVSTLSTFGTGADQAYATAKVASVQEVDDALFDGKPLHRFAPVKQSQLTKGSLRVPKPGTLDDLRRVFAANRVASRTLSERRKKRWPKIFDRIEYSGMADSASRPFAVFRLLDEDRNIARYPHARLIHIAGMVRHAAIECMKGNTPNWKRDDLNWLETFVCGHRGDSQQHRQISFVPLPSIGHEHADAMIRNVMLIAPIGCEEELEYVANRIDGERLTPEHQFEPDDLDKPRLLLEPAMIERFTPPKGRFIDNYYLGKASIWQSVTPVILDGHNRKSKAEKPEVVAKRTVCLIQTALQRAGIEAPCEFTWQSIPFLKNCLSAHKYDRNGRHTGYHRPQHLRTLTAVHLQIRFGKRDDSNDPESHWLPAENAVPGPITIGAGRHCGFGLMAAID